MGCRDSNHQPSACKANVLPPCYLSSPYSDIFHLNNGAVRKTSEHPKASVWARKEGHLEGKKKKKESSWGQSSNTAGLVFSSTWPIQVWSVTFHMVPKPARNDFWVLGVAPNRQKRQLLLISWNQRRKLWWSSSPGSTPASEVGTLYAPWFKFKLCLVPCPRPPPHTTEPMLSSISYSLCSYFLIHAVQFLTTKLFSGSVLKWTVFGQITYREVFSEGKKNPVFLVSELGSNFSFLSLFESEL